jgi:hypothetical protein
MYNLKSKEIHYQSVDGEWRVLRPMSVLKAQNLFSNFNHLIEYMDKQDEEKEIWELYREDSYFANLCNRCLTLSGIDPKDCSPEMLITFLFPHRGEDGKPRNQGVIFSFNFGESKKTKKGKQELSDLIAGIWLATEDLNQALEAVDKLSNKDLEALLNARAYLLKPQEEKNRQIGYDKAMEIMKQKGMVIQ